MILTEEELRWIDERIKFYGIKFIEVRHEILDHMITAIEERREAGDHSNVETLFNCIADEHFGGYQGIEALEKKEQKLCRQRMHQLFWEGFRYYINWPMGIASAAFLAFSFLLPVTKPIEACFLTVILILAFTPYIYGQVIAAQKIKLHKGERSLVKSFVIMQVSLPMFFLNALIYWPRIVMALDGASFDHSFKRISPAILAIVIIVYMIGNLSCIRLCRKVLKFY